MSYLFGEDTETPNVFHMFEAYLGGRDGFEQHSRTPHYGECSPPEQLPKDCRRTR